MAIIDDLVASGLSLPQAQKVIDFNAGVGTQADFVAQGFSGVQATAIYGGAPSEAELANAGFSIPQESAIIDALDANDAPVANAGPNQSVSAGSAVDLDGSGSYDPNGDPLVSYEWTLTTKPAGSAAVLDDDTVVDPTFDTDKVGTYVATLVVGDGTLESAPSTVTITAYNTAPTADAGNDQTVETGDTVNLDGSGSSDPQGDALTYAWTMTTKPLESTATLTGSTTETPSFTADVAGEYVVTLVVDDGDLSSEPSTVTITAEDPPAP